MLRRVAIVCLAAMLGMRSIMSFQATRGTRWRQEVSSILRLSSSSTHPGDLLREGAEVEFVTGGKGFLVEKIKGGWWKVAVNQSESSNPLMVKVRTSAFRLPASALASTSSGAIASAQDNNKAVPLSDIDAVLAELTGPNDAPAPPPPYILQTLEAPAAHAATKKWIIFSDLHVKGSSIDCCAEVLKEVHTAALERDAGIIFLGDFWHVRGALNVELLNKILRSLRQWTQPVIMIPGNHDQVTLGGSVHALEPLIYAFRPEQALLISEPAVCLGALWIPYRRDPQLMQRILRAGASSPESVGIIYCHADVRGAYMNDGMRSREGLDIDAFPPGLPIFSGHFHKPHTISKGSSSLRYVGSPYQTSLSEAGQDKFLYCMSYQPASAGAPPVWREDERWTLDVGKKYFKVLSVHDSSMDKARAGDRVVLPVRIGEDAAAEAVLQRLRVRGVEVELRRERMDRPMKAPMTNAAAAATAASASAGSDSAAAGGSLDGALQAEANPSTRDPLQLFVEFMGTSYARDATTSSDLNALGTNTTHHDIAEDAAHSLGARIARSDSSTSTMAKQALHDAVLQEGRETLLRLMNTEAGAGASARIAGSKVCELRLESVQLSNFGPFGGEKVKYPLAQRGLVLIRGQSTDGTGADSNGAGKTTLAMSVMWALTGSMDARLVADGKAVDVAYDAGSSSSKRTAEVSLHGQINGKPFELTRRRGARKADLTFSVDGKDLTTLAVKDTQAIIDDTLGIGNGLLQRCCFFGQHSHTLQSLLGLTDVRLKSELSCLVNVELWSLAAQDVRSRERADKTRIAEISVEVRVRGEELDRSIAANSTSLTALVEMEAKLSAAKETALAEMGRGRGSITQRFGNASVSNLSAEIDACQREVEAFRRDVLEPLRGSSIEAMRRHATACADLDSSNSTLRERLAQVRSAAVASQTLLSSLQNKTRQMDIQARTVETSLKKAFIQYLVSARHMLPQDAPQTPEAVSLETSRAAQEAALTVLAGLDARIEAVNVSLRNLHAVDGEVFGHDHKRTHEAPLGNEQEAPCAAHKSSECPTCGQTLPADLRQTRETELLATLTAVASERLTQVSVTDDLRSAVDYAVLILQTREQLAKILENKLENQSDCEAAEAAKRLKDDDALRIERELAIKTVERAELEREFRRLEGDKEREAAAAGERYVQLQARESALRKTLDALREAESTWTSLEGKTNSTLALLEDRVRQAQDKHRVQAEVLGELQAVMAGLKAQENDITARGLVLERLDEVLGPRGIQHYVFMSTLKQLEAIANAYLQVLAEGGVQLTLQGDEDADRIVKTVWVRAADGAMRERGLSQLSGGQWRRVSMALDLAFAEIIRRRGSLRSNLIVMDEVLTHLDASGREAVGSVLRAMVDGPRAGETMPEIDSSPGSENGEENDKDTAFAVSQELSRTLLGGGAYETAIVILQDLSAMELEEAFDHVDVVVKATDTSKVLIDGN